MRNELGFASFFSGVGGMDRGLEAAGWQCVSHSENEPYAAAILEQHWPNLPNYGDITRWREWPDGDWQRATLWAGGPPCQDFSVAGKRVGLASARSGLATTWFDAVGQYRPRAVVLENVPGLLSSHGGRDMAALIGTLVELGYGVGYRILDARHFGVPQRRRRVFILGLSSSGRAGAERAAEILSVGSRCRRHPPTGSDAKEVHNSEAEVSVREPHRSRPIAANRIWDADIATCISTSQERNEHPGDVTYVVSGPQAPSDRDRSLDGLASRMDEALPIGLDSHRYRCCGNGVVSNVAEWIGIRLRDWAEHG